MASGGDLVPKKVGRRGHHSPSAGARRALLSPVIVTGKLVQREQISIDLAGQTPVSVTLQPCGRGAIVGEVVDGKVSTRFPVCGEVSNVLLRFKDFETVCSMSSMDDVFANNAPWRFRVVDRKCELISY